MGARNPRGQHKAGIENRGRGGRGLDLYVEAVNAVTSGEPTAAVVPSAIANAVYDAVGVRLRSVPFTPQKVRAALS